MGGKEVRSDLLGVGVEPFFEVRVEGEEMWTPFETCSLAFFDELALFVFDEEFFLGSGDLIVLLNGRGQSLPQSERTLNPFFAAQRLRTDFSDSLSCCCSMGTT